MHNLLLNRPMSGFPVSIGTSLSLETLFEPIQSVYDDTRNIPKYELNYDVLFINIQTLIRNLLSSLKFEELQTLKLNEIYEALHEEIGFLSTFTPNINLPIEFYINSYSYPYNAYKNTLNKLRVPTTARQMYIEKVTDFCLSKAKSNFSSIHYFTKFIKLKRENKCLVFTHIPWDLLSYTNFAYLALLESHTGEIKTRAQWNTKYHAIPGKDMSILPFFEYLLVTFGDSVMFHPNKLENRLKIYDQLVRKNVHPLMSEFNLL